MLCAAVALCLSGGAAAAACGSAEAPCEVAGRSYVIESPSPGAPALIYLHGYGGSGAGALRNRGLVEAVTARGYAFVAPDGLPMAAGRRGFRWAFRAPDRALEIEFLAALKADLAATHDAETAVLSGFSNGAFMVAYLACSDPAAFDAYAAVAGGFWRPHPEGCAGPVRLHMTHGWTDGVVPLEGRILRGESRDDPQAVVQGDIFRTLEIFRLANGCRLNRPEGYGTDGDYMIRRWESCAAGSALEFALHPGGHGVPRGWADLAIDWLEAEATPGG